MHILLFESTIIRKYLRQTLGVGFQEIFASADKVFDSGDGG